MDWDYAMAKKLKIMAGRTAASSPFLEGTVVRKQPLTVSLCGGEVMAPPLKIRLTGRLAGSTWEPGQHVLCAIMDKSLVLIDRLM